MKRSLLLAVPVSTVVMAGLLAPLPAVAAEEDITILVQNMEFVDGTRTVKQGSTVTRTFGDFYPHTSTSDQGFWSVTGFQGAKGSNTFNSAGTFAYHCAIHTHLMAAITVPLRKSAIPGGKRIQWSVAKQEGRTYDVQIKRPGSTKWEMYRVATSKLALKFRSTVVGKYFFRARTRNDNVAKYSGWSPAKGVKISG